jgi:hypothetical protein
LKKERNSKQNPMEVERDFTVFVRLRPCLPYDTTSPAEITTLETQITLKEKTPRTFNAHKVFNERNSTKDLYDAFISKLVDFSCKGGMSNILAYGQTSSGKTFTMSGVTDLIGDEIFRRSLSNSEISICSIEISCGNKLADLLNPSNVPSMIEDMQGIVQFSSTFRKVSSSDEFRSTVEAAWTSRKTSATFRNEASSRSHCIFRIVIRSTNDPNATPGVLQLIDLAGSERASIDSKNHDKERMKESIFINKSLMTLKECIRQRTLFNSNTSVHIPYRGSKLTLALKEAFEISSRQPSHTLVIANVSPLELDLSATVNTLRYASSLLIVPPKVTYTPHPDDATYWSHEKVLDWIKIMGGSLIKTPEKLCPYENGLMFSKIPEAEFVQRCSEASNGKMLSKRATELYLEFWKLVVNERTRKKTVENKQRLKEYKKRVLEDNERFSLELNNRINKEL